MAPEPFSGTAHEPVTHHVLSVLVENKAGVLSRVAGLFSRRGFNIQSLTVAPVDETERLSRFTIVVDAESAPLDQIVGQLNKLINVLDIRSMRHGDTVERELLLATAAVSPENRSELLRRISHAGAAIIDFSEEAVTVALTGTPAAVEAFEVELGRLVELTDVQKTGRVVLPRLNPSA